MELVPGIIKDKLGDYTEVYVVSSFIIGIIHLKRNAFGHQGQCVIRVFLGTQIRMSHKVV